MGLTGTRNWRTLRFLRRETYGCPNTMTDPSDDGKEPYPDGTKGGWPEDDEELPFNADAVSEDWKVPHPDDTD